jgi:hypothetical protein
MLDNNADALFSSPDAQAIIFQQLSAAHRHTSPLSSPSPPRLSDRHSASRRAQSASVATISHCDYQPHMLHRPNALPNATKVCLDKLQMVFNHQMLSLRIFKVSSAYEPPATALHELDLVSEASRIYNAGLEAAVGLQAGTKTNCVLHFSGKLFGLYGLVVLPGEKAVK